MITLIGSRVGSNVPMNKTVEMMVVIMMMMMMMMSTMIYNEWFMVKV